MIEIMTSFSRSVSLKQRVSTIGSPRAVGSPRLSRRSWSSRSILIPIGIAFVLSFFLAIGLRYLYVLPSLTQTSRFQDNSVSGLNGSDNSCDLFYGDWILDDRYPLYNASECPFVEQGFNCLENGRKDDGYLKWRWKPKSCAISKFNVQHLLQMLRNKRIVFVGDSMSRTQWESLICLLMTGVEDKKSVYEVNRSKITKQIRFLGARFSSLNFTIEFFRSVFLVQHNWAPRRGPKRVRSTLRLDKLDDISNEWINSDVLIFNTGQWWVPGKLFGMGCYFQIGNTLKLGLPIDSAFRIALNTWSTWIDRMIDSNRTRVFFRTFEPSHWSNQTLRLCDVTTQPLSETRGYESSPFSDTILDVVKTMAVPVTVLHITPLSAFRSDAHVGLWGDKPNMSDCSHWCLPGVPDTWNELLLTALFSNKEASFRSHV
ncbi:OLC1v1008683C2 [Oldenlandia corymbosa var. corymbosa]|uniref:OLC1v1008683C2 n=1 Tax=Oldenlandia corymbosa var. corymbosa TaxID=529605 RepID=A0AAV1DNP3_OLDCO|nr:OLC1v1008683C2 [Oldenlandia corymbosa var. corymbosa]